MRERKQLLFGDSNPAAIKTPSELEDKKPTEENLLPSREEPQDKPPVITEQTPPTTEEPLVSPAEDGTPSTKEVTEDTSPEPEEFDFKLKVDPAQIIADAYKEQGALPEDFEWQEGLTFEDLQNQVWKYNHEKIRGEVLSELEVQLAEQYGGEEVLSTARRIRLGTTVEDIKQEDRYKILSSVSFNTSDPNFKSYAKEYLSHYYQEKGLADTEAAILISNELQSENLSELLEQKRPYFQNKFSELVAQNREQEQARIEADKKAAEEQLRKTQTILDRGEFGGMKFTPQQVTQIKSALFDRNEVITGEDGKRHRVTKYEKINYEMQQDPELQLKYAAQIILNNFLPSTKKEKEKEVKRHLNRALNKYVEVVPNTGSQKTLDQALSEVSRERKVLKE